ncbi:MAG: PepSY-like domain-containing protein [Prolixibacteraceae bacterium]
MKSLIVIMVFAFSCFISNAQDKAPESVLKAFQQKFLNTEKVKWEMEDATEWEAEFKINGAEMSASFNLKGQWLETETEIAKKDLPEAVSKSLAKAYARYDIKEASLIEKPGFSGYEIALEKGETEVEVVMTKAGEITSKKVKTEDEEEDDEN